MPFSLLYPFALWLVPDNYMLCYVEIDGFFADNSMIDDRFLLLL